MNDLLEKLANAPRPRESSEHLTLLGKRAARVYREEELGSLTEAVASIVGEEDLNKDQIRRVTETANQATWQSLFHEGGKSDAAFDPADSDAVIGQFDTKPDQVAELNLDYSKDVPNQSTPDDFDLAEIFGIKDDAPEYAALNPAGQEVREQEKVASAVDVARYGADLLLNDLAELGEEFYHHVKQAHLQDGVGILQMSNAVGRVLNSPEYATTLMQQAAGRLQGEGVRFDSAVEQEKVAHRVVINTEHPLLISAVKLEKVARSYYNATDAHDKLREAHRRASHAVRDKLRGV